MIEVETRIELPAGPFLAAPESVFRKVMETAAVLAETAAKKLQSGPVLNVVSGFLSSRTNARVEQTPEGYLIRLGNPQRYSRILELGGHTGPHIIRPKKPGGVLVYERGGETVFAKLVHHPGSTFPPRPTLRPPLEEAARTLPDRMDKAVRQATT